MRKDQIEFGNEMVGYAKEAVKEVGWEQAAFAVMFAHMNAATAFTKHIPQQGKPGCEVVTNEQFYAAFQEMVGSLALMAAVMAEKVGSDLTMHASEAN